jgi:hypothetical protein
LSRYLQQWKLIRVAQNINERGNFDSWDISLYGHGDVNGIEGLQTHPEEGQAKGNVRTPIGVREFI